MDNLRKYRILELMKDNGLSAMELATKCQVHIQSVYYWGNISIDSHFSMPADQLKKMAKIFEISMDEMYTESKLVTA